MFDFVTMFHKDCEECCLTFSQWKALVMSDSEFARPVSRVTDLHDVEGGVSSSIRSILFGVQQVMVRYEDVMSSMSEGDSNYNETSLFQPLTHMYGRYLDMS